MAHSMKENHLYFKIKRKEIVIKILTIISMGKNRPISLSKEKEEIIGFS